MPRIATLTLNPAIDGASETASVRPTVKTRTTALRFDPGGGGINVARVLARLGADVEALYLAGGLTGPLFDGLLAREGLNVRRIAIAGDTRISLVVRERTTGQEFRFVPEGPLVSAAELRACHDAVAALAADWLVISGSLPRGAEPGFMAELVRIARASGKRVVVDSSGPALAAALAAGGIDLVKPSLEEMEQLAGRPLRDADSLLAAAQAVVASGGARALVVSLGRDGGLLVADGVSLRLPAIDVPVESAVGAGDSCVAAMTWALTARRSLADAFRYGMAAGAAAVMTPGTDLARAEDIHRLAASLGV